MGTTERQWRHESADGIGDSFTVAHGGGFEFTLDEPWAGDSETGFGRKCTMSLPEDQAVSLARWILKRAGQ